MKTRIVAIGSSRGIRIPKPLREGEDLREDEEVDLRPTLEGLAIERVSSPRFGGSSAAAELAFSRGSDDEPFVPTEFDAEDWNRWRSGATPIRSGSHLASRSARVISCWVGSARPIESGDRSRAEMRSWSPSLRLRPLRSAARSSSRSSSGSSRMVTVAVSM